MPLHIARNGSMTKVTRKGSKWKQAFAGVPGAIVESSQSKTPWPILKKRLDEAFSELIRMTHADDNGMVKCIDGCGLTGHWKDFDCGHFVSRNKLATRWHMNNARPQSKQCNRNMNGRQYEFGVALNRESPGLADRMFALSEGPADQIRHNADQLLIDIRAKLKIQRARFR